MLEKEDAVELYMFIAVGGCGWLRGVSIYHIGIASRQFFNKPPLSASAAEENICLSSFHTTWIGSLMVGTCGEYFEIFETK